MQRIFEDHAQEYYEHGLQPIPTKPFAKACLIKGYNKDFYEAKLSQEKLDYYIEKYPTWDLGLVCGEMSGVIGIDFDYDGFKESALLESMLLGGLPETPAIKKGAKGWTRFYKYSEVFSSSRNLKRFVPEKNREETFLDILSNKKITIMPPSRHKNGSDLLYEWVGPKHLVDCLDYLPELTVEDLEHIEYVWKFDTQSVEKEIRPTDKDLKSRHDKIFGFVMRYSNTSEGIEDLVSKVLAFDLTANANDAKGPYFEDKKYLKNKPAQDVCRELVLRLCEWKQKSLLKKGIDWEVGKTSSSYWINVGSGEEPKWKRSDNFSDFSRFFATIYPSARKDFMSSGVFYKNKFGHWASVENEEEAMQSRAHEVGLNKGHLKINLARWCLTLKERPLFDIKPYDGKDYIGNAVKHIQFKNFDQNIAVDLFKDWFAGIFKRMKNPAQANRLLILRGAQGKGKDWWVNHMLSGFGHQHGEISFNAKNKIENFTTLYGLITGYISEFDETKEVPIGMLKSLITSKSAMFRLPYDKRAENRLLRYSLIASVNEEDVLRDTTGNRRFMIFDIDYIDWTYKEKVDPQKIIDHAYHLYLQKFEAPSQSEDAMKTLITGETPIDNETLFLEELVDFMAKIEDNMRHLKGKALAGDRLTRVEKSFEADSFKIRYPNISENIEKIGRKYGFRPRRIQNIMKKHGFSYKDKRSICYFLPAKYANGLFHDSTSSNRPPIDH